MIAIVSQYYESGIKLIPNSAENCLLLKAVAQEMESTHSGKVMDTLNCDKLDKLLNGIQAQPVGEIVSCTSAFFYISEW